MKQFPEKETTFLLPGPVGDLEVLFSPDVDVIPAQAGISPTGQKGSCIEIAIICHPHPLFAGTMHNKVVTTLAKTFSQMGYATVRFNYRGVGKSEGEYGELLGEVDDLMAVINWVKEVSPNATISLAGFSFGACVALKALHQITPKQLVLVAPAVDRAIFTDMPEVTCPWVVAQGEEDEVTSAQAVFDWVEKQKPQPALIRMPETSHFFHGKLVQLRQKLLSHFGFAS